MSAVKVGERVRINFGENYGRVGTVLRVAGHLVLVRLGAIEVQCVHPFDVLPEAANNGD